MKSLSDPQISLNGKYVAVIETEIDQSNDGYQDVIRIFELDSGYSSLIKSDSGRLHSPRFSQDGESLAWIHVENSRQCSIQVESVSTILENVQTSKPENAWFRGNKLIGPPVWSPDGNIYAVDVTEVRTDVKVYHDLHYKLDGAGLAHMVQSRIVRLGKQQADTVWTSEDKQLHDLTISQDGAMLAFTLPQSPHREFYIQDLYVLDVQSGTCRLAMKSKGPVSTLKFFPSGDRVAWVGHQGERWNDITQTVHATDLKTGRFFAVAPTFDRPASPYGLGDVRPMGAYPKIVFQPEGEGIWFLASDHGRSSIYSLAIGEMPVEAVPRINRCISYFDVDNSGAFVFTAGTPTRPDTLCLYRDGVEQVLYDANEELFQSLSTVTPQLLTFTRPDDLSIESWLMLPPEELGLKPPYPLVLVIHGGPHNSYGYGFQMEFQTLAAAGFAVLYANPRGSQTYGQAFASAVVRDWGGEDYGDLMQAVDNALATGLIDAERMGVTGYSYGGYMTNWIITHTDRFKAAATGGCVSNLISMSGASDVGPTFIFNEHDATVWGDAKTLWKRSPIAWVENVHTPCLVYHAEGDDRCPIGQSEEFFAALRQLNKEALFVRYTGNSHLFIMQDKPSLRIDKVKRIADWFLAKVQA